MNFKQMGKLTLLALVISMITFSCSKEHSNEVEIITPEIPLLKEKLPDVHDLIDFSAYVNYDFITEDGQSISVEGYAAKENGVVIGYYLVVEDRPFYMANNEERMIRIDMLSDEQLIYPKEFSEEQGRFIPNFERVIFPAMALSVDVITGSRDCLDDCLDAQRVCSRLCLLGQVVLHEWTDIDIMVVGDITRACTQFCRDAALACIAAC